MAQSDQTIRDIVAQLVSNGQPAQAAAPAMGSMMTMPAPDRSTLAMGAYPPAALAPVSRSNMDAAHMALNMSPQEQALYARHLTNLNGPGGVNNPDGSRSTLYQATQEGPGGKFYNIPTVWDGRREVEPYMLPNGSTMDVPNATTMANVAKTGWDTFPSYATPEAADSRYDQMHGYMERDTADYMKQRGQ